MRRINSSARAKHLSYGAAPGHSAVALSAPSIPDASIPWRIGQNVVHPKFGAGVIVSAEGRGPDARVQVSFRNNGLKWLVLEYAKLAPA